MATDHYKETFETWNKAALLYQEKFMDLDIYNDSYGFFCNCINSETAKVLDIGCGPGNISRYLLKLRKHYQIEGTDMSPNMVELAKVNNPSSEFRILDCRKISSIKNKFEGIICGFCIPYLSEKDTGDLISDVSGLLSDNGCFYLSFVNGDPENSGVKINSLGDKSHFQYYHTEDIIQTLLKCGFRIVKIFNINYKKSEAIEEIHTIIISAKEN